MNVCNLSEVANPHIYEGYKKVSKYTITDSMKSLILDFAIERKGEIKIVYEYDFFESLNVITVDNKTKPFIDSSAEDISLLTKTKVKSESDDNDIDMLELKTKTEVNQERDDDYNMLLELKTKTFTQRERDDESFNHN